MKYFVGAANFHETLPQQSKHALPVRTCLNVHPVTLLLICLPVSPASSSLASFVLSLSHLSVSEGNVNDWGRLLGEVMKSGLLKASL